MPKTANPKATNLAELAFRLERGRRYDPFAHAEALGIEVVERPIRTANELWIPDWNLIALRSGLRAAHKRVALAHGIGHADLGHRDDRPKHEMQANRYASLYLIDPNEFRDVAAWAGDDRERLIVELGVTPLILEAYLSRAS